MYPWKRSKPESTIDKITMPSANDAGLTRRALSIVPMATNGVTHEVTYTDALRYHQLLVTLEGQERTGCLKIISPSKKSRSAILLYRGRVVGCLYGRKNLDCQFFGQDAYCYALMDLASPGNILDAYQLPEEFVLAAASLFEGEFLDLPTKQAAKDIFDLAASTIMDSQLPGAAMISSSSEEIACMVYFASGKIIGVYSAGDSWAEPSMSAVYEYIRSIRSPKIIASTLALANVESIGFSLTGVANQQGRSVPALQTFPTSREREQFFNPGFIPNNSLKAKYSKDKHGKQTLSWAKHLVGQHAHMIAP